MAFSILSKELLRRTEIKEIVDKTEEYASIFTLKQQRDFNIEFGISTYLTLKEFDANQTYNYERNFVYEILNKSFNVHSFQYGYVLPIVRIDEIRDNSQIISEDEDTFTIQYGRYLTSRVSESAILQNINMNLMLGNIAETDRRITIFLSKDGKKTQLRVFKNEKTGEEYVFMKKNEDGTFNDSLDLQATFVGIVSPLEWTVDRKTGLAICKNPLFLSERCECEYDKSSLSKFLESDEFIKELGIIEKKEKKNVSVNNPFGEKKGKLSLEQKIRRILMGEKRIPYLVGHPGIGKTQIAKSINKNCLSYNIATFTPDAFTGKTSIVPGDKVIIQDGEKTVEHSEIGRTATAEPEWYTKLIKMSNKCRNSNERCVLLLDEFDKLTPNMQVFINGIVDNPRTIAGWEIPDNVDIILAGNTEEYSDAAFNISGEVASRLTKVEVSADAIDWLKWASKHDIDPIVRAYLHNFPSKIIQDVKDNDGGYDYALSLTPRSWDQKISEELKASRKIKSFPYLDPYMDKKSREEFEEFIAMYFELSVEEILKGNLPSDIFDLTHDRIQIIINCLIATATTEEEIINSLLFIKQNNLSEYQALFEKRWMEINESDDDILKLKLAKNDLNERSSGYGK